VVEDVDGGSEADFSCAAVGLGDVFLNVKEVVRPPGRSGTVWTIAPTCWELPPVLLVRSTSTVSG
jgi:hypothetical protein